MSIAYEDREAKEKWLLRPLRWASEACLFGALVTGFMWYDGAVSIETIAVIATGALFVTFGLIFWSTIRITKAARGRY